MNPHVLNEVVFRTSSFTAGGLDCIEVGHTPVLFGVRDSKLAHSPVLTVTAEQGRVFLNAVKSAQLNQ